MDMTAADTRFVAGGADNNKGRSKKWKKILAFPHISECISIKDELGKLGRPAWRVPPLYVLPRYVGMDAGEELIMKEWGAVALLGLDRGWPSWYLMRW